MNSDAQIGARLKEVRQKLGWSQQKAADAAGIRREMWAKYEAGAEPGAKALAALARAGIDVTYVLTGHPSGSATPAPPAAAPISESDRRLLRHFHAAPAKVQEGVRTTLGAFAPAAGSRPDKAA